MTFHQFLNSSDNLDPEFKERLSKSGVEIDSRADLLRFARERWPGSFRRAPMPNDPYGREAMAKLWGQYLAALEQ